MTRERAMRGFAPNLRVRTAIAAHGTAREASQALQDRRILLSSFTSPSYGTVLGRD
jgi:hypothetical protein